MDGRTDVSGDGTTASGTTKRAKSRRSTRHGSSWVSS